MNCRPVLFACVCMVMLFLPEMRVRAIDQVQVGLVATGVYAAKQYCTGGCAVAVAACVGGACVAKTLWTRCVTLRSIEKRLHPPVRLYIDQRERPFYTWMTGVAGYETPVQIRSHAAEVKAAISTASLSGTVDIFQRNTGAHLTAGHAIYWSDVLSSIDREIAFITRLMRSIEHMADWSPMGFHLFGVRRNFRKICRVMGIVGNDLAAQTIDEAQETEINEYMSAERSLGERIVALCGANPNYGKAHRLFWQLDQCLGRLIALKQAITSSPIQWYTPLH